MDVLCTKCGKLTDQFVVHKTIGNLCSDCYKEYLATYSGVSVYRFISADAFKTLLQQHRLVFSLPSKWKDSFEYSYFKILEKMYSTRPTNQGETYVDPIFLREMLAEKDKYYCQCWTLTQESEFFWNKYGYNNTAVRLEMDLGDLFKMGVRIEPVKYWDLPSFEEYKSQNKDWCDAYKLIPDELKFRVEESGEYLGDPKNQSIELLYFYELQGCFTDYSQELFFERIPFIKMLSTKQDKYAEENEIRLFIKNYENRMEYIDRLFSDFYQPSPDLCTYSKKVKEFYFDIRTLKSIMIHPHASNALCAELNEIIKKSNLSNVFKGKSKLFVSPFD